MPTKINQASLQAQYASVTEEVLREIAGSRDYSEEARKAAREVLKARGLTSPPEPRGMTEEDERASASKMSQRARLILLAVPLLVLSGGSYVVQARARQQRYRALAERSEQVSLERARTLEQDIDPATLRAAERSARGEVALDVAKDGSLRVRDVGDSSVKLLRGPKEIACSKDVGECLRAAAAYERGDGVTPDRAQALHYYDRACEQASRDGCASAMRLRGSD